MNFLIKVIKGFFIGIAAMTAGAGTFAILFGIYDDCMEIIANPFKNFKKNIIYIFPIAFGILISFMLFSNIIVNVYEKYPSYIKFILLGIIIGGVPALIRTANEQGYSSKYLIPFFITFIFTLIITFISKRFENNVIVNLDLNSFHIFIFGIIFAFGAVMPSMSTLPILMAFGVFEPIMTGITNLDLSVIIPFGIGYIILVVLTAKLITFLLNKFYGYTYYAIIGFAVTSVIMLIPKLSTITETITCIILGIISVSFMLFVTKLEKQVKQEVTSHV